MAWGPAEGWLVRDQDVGIVDDGVGEARALAIASRACEQLCLYVDDGAAVGKISNAWRVRLWPGPSSFRTNCRYSTVRIPDRCGRRVSGK